MQSRLENADLCSYLGLQLAKHYWFGNINLIEVDVDFSSAGTKSKAEMTEEPLTMFSKNFDKWNFFVSDKSLGKQVSMLLLKLVGLYIPIFCASTGSAYKKDFHSNPV